MLRLLARVQLHSQPSTLSPHTNHLQSADMKSNKWGMGGEGESEFSPELTPPTGSVHFAKRREIHQGRLDKFMPRIDGQSVVPRNWGQDMDKFDKWAASARDLLAEDLTKIDAKSEGFNKSINAWKDGSRRGANKQGHLGTFDDLTIASRSNKDLRNMLKEPEKVQFSQMSRKQCIALAGDNKKLQADLDQALNLEKRVQPDMDQLEASLIAYNETFFKLNIHHGR